MKRLISLLVVSLLTLATAQDIFMWPQAYAPSASQEGVIQETVFGDITTLNPYQTSSATETAVLGMVAGPQIIYRDWLGSRQFKDADGNYNLFWASDIEEVAQEQEFIITLKEGWMWSDGTEMTADDAIASFIIHGDPEVESNSFSCSEVNEVDVEYEKLGTYQYRVRLPEPQVNALFSNDCGMSAGGVLPAHIYMPIYEEQGAAGVKALWGVDTDPSEVISGGPYLISEFRPGERLILEKNPMYGQFVQAADGSPLPGPDTWNVTVTEDRNAELSLIVTGQANFYWPTTLDEVRAVNEAVNSDTIGGEFFPNISPSTSVDFITYNFNNTDECKRAMFSEPMFRQAVSTMIDRDSLVQAAVGGLGFPARDYNGDAAAPFNAPDLAPFEFNPEAAVDMLAELGFTELNDDGILFNPETGCEVAFDLQFNSGNNRRGQLAQVISQTAAPFGVSINPLEVSVDIWQESIVGDLDYDETGERTRDYDAQIWGLAGGDVDNPSSVNVLGLNTNLNSWNKSATDVEDWEVEMSEISYQMDGTLDLDERVELYNQRAQIMRDFLPITPLINQSFHIYTNMSNSWPESGLDANSIESPYRPSGFRNTLAAPSQ
ncbi:MAG: ABC transporter substrate-binding protein [Deinococcota bacterium]